MAKKRCIPTDLFYQRAFVRLSSDTTRLILIGLISDADDYGRGSADSALLGRKLDHPPQVIEQTLAELTAAGFVQCYGPEEEPCYALCAWSEWQTLSKPTPSKYPAPPSAQDTEPQAEEPSAQNSPKIPREILGNSGLSHIPQGHPEKPRDVLSEEEEERKRTEEEGELTARPANVVSFPAAAIAEEERKLTETTRLLARILKLKVTPDLRRIVEDFGQSPGLKLAGEADAAREWIDDRQRNRRGQRMTPGFFRRWLKRELEAVQQREAERHQWQVTGTDGGLAAPTSSPPAPGSRAMPPSLMDLERSYRTAMEHGGGGDKSGGNDKDTGGEA